MNKLGFALAALAVPLTLASAQTRLRQPTGATLIVSPPPGGPPPSSLRAGGTPTSIHLHWTCPSGAIGYEVFATPTGGAQVKLTATPIGPQCLQDLALAQQPRLPNLPPPQPVYRSSFVHSNLHPSMELTYSVAALYATGGPAYSEPIVARPAPWPAPANATATPQPARGVTVGWSLVSGASAYAVFRKLQGESESRNMTPAPVAGPPWQDNTPLPPGRHEYQVQAIDGTLTPPIAVTMGPWPAPTGVSLTLNDRRATLVWKEIPGATGYQVFRKAYLQPAFQLVGAPTDHWFVEDNLPVGSQQYYVTAVGGDPTNPMSVLVGKPEAGARIYRGTTVFDLGWLGASLATGFSVLQGPAAAGPWVNVTNSFEWPTPTLARNRKADPAVTLYYKVVATYSPTVYPPLLIESDPVQVTFPKPPQGPANLTARAAAWDPAGPQPPTRFVVHLSWTCDPEAVGYKMMVGRTGRGREWIMGYGGRPLEIKTCSFGAGPVSGAIGDSYTYAVIPVYRDPDTSGEASVTVALAP